MVFVIRMQKISILILSLLIVFASSISHSNFQLTDSNQGAHSSYIFSFTPDIDQSNLQAIITFPIEYSISTFASSVECYFSSTGQLQSYVRRSCWVEPDSTSNALYLLGSVVVELSSANSTIKNYVLLKNVKNPTTNSSSYFQFCLRKNGIKVECMKYFSKAIFSLPAVSSLLGLSITPSPAPTYIGRGTTYTFSFKLNSASLAYASELLFLRVKLDPEFSSEGPICSIGTFNSLGLRSQYVPLATSILPETLNEVDCGPINNILSYLGPGNEIVLKIDNMINALNEKNYSNSKVQIVRQIYMQPVETIQFPSSLIAIAPQNIQVEIKQSNYMKKSTNVYYFMLNHFTDLNESSSVTVEFLSNTWMIHGGFGMFGFTSPGTLQTIITGNKIKFLNYGKALHKDQQVFGVNLTSLDLAGEFPVQVTTLLFDKIVGQFNGTVYLNETIGTMNLLSVSAVQKAVKLPVDKTGPLEMTFFLNYELPPSDDVTNGTLEITIYPQIPEPDPQKNGVVKCYWKGTLQAANCTYDNSVANRTVITLISPPHDSFKYSEIPVIITTEGGETPEDLGLTIDPLVQRYRFQCQFYLYNSSAIPSEVFYTTWIADAIQMTTNRVLATTHECDQYTHIQINMTTPLLDLSLPKQFRIMVQFLNADGSGWARSVGYQIDKIYQRYPCVVVGLVGMNINCDLYTYYERVTPYSNMHINNNVSGPYILIYGFDQNIAAGLPIRIQIPKIKVGSVQGSSAILGISILQQTPGEKEPYVELYYEDVIAFQTKAAISKPFISVPSSQLSPIQIQTFNQYNFTWFPDLPSSVKYITYQMTPQYLPSLTNKDAVCTTNQCVGLGLPANWIFQTPASVGAPHTMLTLLNYVQSMNYLPQTQSFMPVRMFTYDGAGNTLNKYRMDIHYIAKPIQSSSFDFVQTKVYSGLQQWYSISFANTNSSLSQYPFLRFILKNGLSFSDPPQCNSSTILPYNQSGMICVRENPQTMRVYNIKSLATLGTYNIWFRMETTSISHTAPISPQVDIHINHNNSVDSSIVSLKQNLNLTQGPVLPLLNAPQKFEIHNPQIVNEDIQIGYIGPLYIQFISQVSGVYDIDVEFSPHLYNGGYWRTPTSSDLDPVVCLLNELRYDCTPTNGLTKVLKISTLQVSLNSGLNQLRFDTEYIDPFNGIKFPDVPGMYSIKLTIFNSTASAPITFYAEIQPPKFLHMQAGSIVKDIDTETVFKVNFTLPAWHIYPNSYFDPANRSRITIQFPTLIGDTAAFSQKLGLYQGKFQERVGCFFKTGANYLTFAPGYLLECRLIPSGKLGDPVKVEIVNHNFFSAAQNSLSVYIFKVVNPALSHSSVPITVRIDHIQVNSGNTFPLYKQTFRVFLDPRPKNGAPVTYPSVDDPSVQFFQATKDVGDYGSIFMNSHTLTSNPVNEPYYMLVKLPDYFDPETNQIAPAFSACPPSSFQECVSVPEINYLMVKAKFNTSQFQAVIKNYPISISLTDSFFYSNVIESGRFTGIIQYNVSAKFRWQQIQGTLTLVFCQATGLQSKTVKNKDHFELAISFTTTNFIPEQGSIEIGFPAGVTNVKPHCRSSVELGSGLKSRSGNSGEIGCMVQNTNKWVITGFADVPPGTNIIIRGQVDLPSASGTIGLGEIITYADTNLVDIHTNGSRIDYLLQDFNLILIDSFAMNPNPDVFMTQRDVIRAGFIGQFRQLLQSALPIAISDSITLRMAMNDIRGTPGGFSQSFRPKVCEFIRIDTNQQIGCKVINEMTDISILGQQCILYQLQPSESLLASQTYQIRLTSQSYIQPTLLEGINYPSSPGTYKIETTTTISGISKTQHRYIQVYGPAFNQLKVTQYNYLAGQYNLIWVEFIPTVAITPEHQIIVQFPTLSSNGTKMFDDNLGLNGYKDGDEVPVDIFNSPPNYNNYMKCRIYFGDNTRGTPVRVVCGFLLTTLNPGTYLRFAFGFINPPRITVPTIPSQISLPLLIYSYDPFYFEKTNFNLVNAAVLVYNGQQILVPNGYFATDSNQLQTKDDNLNFGNANTFPLLVGDSYVMRFNFPLRVNDLYAGYCKSPGGTVTFGDAYYHEKLRIIVCKVTTTIVPAQISPSAATMSLSGFYTPWYRLADSERIVHAMATYHSTSTSEVINYLDLFPHLPPKWQFPGWSAPLTVPKLATSLQLQTHLKHNIACQSDDYIFRVRLEGAGSGNFDLQYCRLISIHLPLTTVVDYFTLNTDCVEHPDSQIQIVRCNIDLSARAIFVQIVPGNYSNGLLIAVKTKDHALRNPCVFWNMFSISQFVVYFYSWQNITYADSRSISYAYMVMDRRNILPLPAPFGYAQQVPGGLLSYYYTFDWVHTPHERTYNQFPQYTLDQYSPFSFDVWLSTAFAPVAIGGPLHRVQLKYGLNYVTRSSQWVHDLNYDKTVCYLHNNRVQRCYLDNVNKIIYMQFAFAVPAGRPVHVYFSILDPRQPHYNGFRYVGASDIDKVRVDFVDASGLRYVFETEPFMAKQTHIGGTGQTLPQRGIRFAQIDWATNMVGRLNVLDMTLHVNRSDITGLQFIIPQVNEINEVLYNVNSRTAFFSINDGGQYPCGNNHPSVTGTGNPKCFIYNGDNSQMGFPTIITMVDFQYSGSVIKARLLLHNPDVVMKWFTIKVRAFSGTPDSQTLFGHQYVGYWYFVNIFRTVPGTYSSLSVTNDGLGVFYLSPNKGNWRDQTTWFLKGATAGGNTMAVLDAGLGGYAIVEVLLDNQLSSYTDKQFCMTQFIVGSSASDDMLILKSKQQRYTKAFFIKKWQANPWNIQYFKCKHYGNGLKSYQYPTQQLMQFNDHSFIVNSFYQQIPSKSLISYFEQIKGRVFLQYDITLMMTDLTQTLFRWENDVSYELNIQLFFGNSSTWSANPSNCYITGGFLNKRGSAPLCTVLNALKFKIHSFGEILTKKGGNYVIKIQLDVLPIFYGVNSISGTTLTLYANSDSNNPTLQKQFLYQTTISNTYQRIIRVTENATNPRYQTCNPSYSNIESLFGIYNDNNRVKVQVQQFGLNVQNQLNIKFLITSISSFSLMEANYYSYPELSLYIEGFDYICNGINSMEVTYINSAQQRFTQVGLSGTSFSANEESFKVRFQPKGVHLNSPPWSGLSIFTAGQSIQVKAQLSIIANQKSYLRDWIGVRTFINIYHIQMSSSTCGITCTPTIGCPCFCQKISLYSFSQQALSSVKLADNMVISALSTNIQNPTEFIFTMTQVYPEIGRNNVDKLLLIQFNTAVHPFNYINNTAIKNHLIECRCITSWSPSFDPSTTVNPECYLRLPQLSFINFAITIDIDVAPNQNLQCFFPGWQANTPFTYTATAKLINQGSSFPPFVDNNQVYGGLYWAPSINNLAFSAAAAPTSLTLTESPSIYTVLRTVNLAHTSSYVLTIATPSSILNPIVYIDFQKSGFIPDQSFCSSASVFTYCRVYNTLQNLIVAQFSTPVAVTQVSFTKGAVNLQYPKHKEPGTNYDILAYMRSGSTNQYVFSGNLARSNTQLLTTTVQFNCQPEKATSTNLETVRTNLVLSFVMGGHSLFSYPKRGAKIVITESFGLLSLQRGCTAASVDNPAFDLDCFIIGSQINVVNPSYTATLSVSGLIQVVVGVTNPSTPVTWTIKSYEYWFDLDNFGQQIQSVVTYTPKVQTGTEQLRSQIRTLPFNTKVYSTEHTPFRIAFKLSNNPPPMLPPPPNEINYDTIPTQKMILKQFDWTTSNTNFQCLFKEYTLEPTQKPQSPLPNPYRNWKQNTQYIPLYAHCKLVGNDIEIQPPRTKPLQISYYYELVIMPTGTGLAKTGFPNTFDSRFKLITFPDSCEYIGELMLYSGHMFKLNSMYLVTYRPLVDTALQLHFQLGFASNFVYPNHYFQIHFQDINYNAIKAPYNQKGMRVPCTLSSQFVTAGRINGPRCIVNHVHEPHGDLVLRVIQIGNLPMSNSYKLSLDDFLLPDLSTLLEQSNPFSVCLRYHNQPSKVHHQRCFEELFVVDGTIITTPMANTNGVFYNPAQNSYAATVTGKLQFAYPITSTSLIEQKSMARIKGGYSATSPAPISFGSHTLLWFNPQLNLYILRQPSVSVGTILNITMNGLVNPEPYQKQEYSFINTIDMTYYDRYHPVKNFFYNQPPYSYFVIYPSLVKLDTTYLTDIRTKIPTDSQSIVKFGITITETVAELTRKLNNLFEITFNPADISEVQECWVQGINTPVPYRKNGWCQSTTDGRVLLKNFYESNVGSNLVLFVRMRHISNTIRAVSKLYSDNNQIQYNDTYTFTISKIQLTTANHLILSFTENYYTGYYFEQAITPLSISSTCKYLHFSLNLPQDIIHQLTIFTIILPPTIVPSNIVQLKHKCQWLLVDRYNRQFHTGVYSHCVYNAGKIVVTAPYGGLLASNGGIPYTYLLRVRELDVINTKYFMPTTSKPEEIEFGFNDTNIFKYDTMIIHPYEHFSSLNPWLYTLNVNQLNTYHIEFIPTVTVATGFEAVLQLSIDTRYLVKDLGMPALFGNYGIDYNNSTRIDNLNYNIKYDALGNKWRNGAPYTCFTSTASLPNQTTIHTGGGLNNKRTRITHLLEPSFLAGTKYIWKVPLLLNPSIINTPFRMNLTLWTYQATGIGFGQKELFYEIINHKFTKPNNPSSFSYTIPLNNPIQVTNANISIKFSSVGDVPILGEYAQLKLNNHLTGMIGLNNLQFYTEADSSYTFYFFPRINLLMAHKKVTDYSTNIDLGSLFVTNEYVDYYGYDWIKIHSASSENTVRKSGPLSKILTHCVINPVSLFAVAEGIGNIKDSEFLLTLTFVNSNCWIPRNSTMTILYDSAVLESLYGTRCYISFRQYSCVHRPGRVDITFYDKILIGVSLNIRFYLRAKGSPLSTTVFTGYIFGIPATEFTKIIQFPNIGSLAVNSDNLIDSPLFEHIQTNYIYEKTQMDIRGTFISNNPLTYIDIIHPFTSSLASLQRMIMRKNSTSPYLFDYRTEYNWVQNIQTVTSNVQAKYVVPPNGLLAYNVLPSNEHTFILESTYDLSGMLNNFTVGPVGSYYLFQYLTQNEIAYQQVYPISVSDHLTIINPFTQVSQQTAIGVKFSVMNHTISPGDRITIQLDTHNLRYDMFRKSSQFSIECVQRTPKTITWQPFIVCQTTQQPTPLSPNRALIVTVYPKISIAAGKVIEIWLSPIFNPDRVMVSGVIVRVDRNCNGEKRCVIYQARGYYRTTTGMNMNTGLVGTFTPSQTQVLLKNVNHQYTILPDTYTAMFFRYPENYQSVMPIQCTEPGGNTCLVFPNQKRVLTLLTNFTSNSITLGGMNNGIHLQPLSKFIDVLALTPTSSNLYSIPHNNLTTRKMIPTTAAPNWMTITPTQTPGIFLRNYMNTATIKIFGLYSTTFVNCFYINAPKEIITWETKYCNATFESLNHDPYPTRLLCSFINDTTLQILIPEGVQQNYLPNITQEFVMTVHAKFFIQNFAPGDGILYVTPPVISNTFNAYGSHSITDHSYPFYITEASTTIVISQHRVPIVGKADFNTESFYERLANINEPTTFELLIDPNTTQPVKRIQLVIPEQFGYPPIGVHDACELITTDTTYVSNCFQIRKNNKTIISLELVDVYDNGPRILKVGSQNITNWFKAPSIPGSWYNMTVLLYSANGTLIQAQTTQNCSQIGGQDLSMPGIVVTNGRDENQNQIVDVSFVVGNLSIRKGYSDGLSLGQYYTEIRIIFENLQAFDRSLGLNKLQGQLTGCTTRNIIFFKEVSCALDVGLNVNDEPFVLVTGYEPIMPGTNVTISLANILNLPLTENSTVSVAVILKRVGDTKSAFLYNPTKKVLLSTSPLLTSPPTLVFVNYNSPRIINSPTILNFTITPTVQINSYFVIKFPADGLNDQYKLFSPDCSLAQRVDIFYRSDVIRIYPKTPHPAGISRSYIITGFPSPKFTIGPVPWNVTVESYRNLKQANTIVYTIPNFEMASCTISFGIISISSPYTHDTEVTYVFEFVISRSSASSENSLTIGVKFPSSFGDLRTTNMTCAMNTNATCQFTRQNYLQITGTRESGELTHRLTLNRVSNPSTLSNIFLLTSYIGQNIENIMCSGQSIVNLLNSTVKICSLDVTTQHSTKQVESLYRFGFTCPDVIKNNSVILIKMPNSYSFNNQNSVPCWADVRQNLLTEMCSIKYINGTFYIEATNVIINKNEKIITINAKLNNPILTGSYTFNANISVNNYTYSTSTIDNITIFEGVPTTIPSLELVNLPQQSGADAYYFFRIPTANINSSIELSFPSQFELSSQLQVQKFVSNSSSWASTLNYQDIVNISGTPLVSEVQYSENLNQKINIMNSDGPSSSSGSWTYFIISPVRNPAYQSQQSFTVNSYFEVSPQQKLLVGTKQTPLNYTLNPPSGSIIHTNISVADNDVLYFSDYVLTYRLSSPHQTNLTTLYIKPPLPEMNYGLIELNCCLVVNSSTLTPKTYCNKCTIIKDSFKFPIVNGLQIPSDTDFQIKLMKLYNPPNATDCTQFPHFLNSYFNVQFFKNDFVLTHVTKPPVNTDGPCQKFRALRADIIPTFPSVLYAGLVHPFRIKLSEPTKMLKVILNCTDPLVTFVPNMLYFPNYDVVELSGSIVVSSVAINNNKVYINVTHIESGTFDMYRPNLPYPIKIIADHKQYIIIEEKKAESIGYDITVPINISQPSSVDMYLEVVATPNSSSLIFKQSQILLPAFSKSGSFTFRYDGNTIPQTFNVSFTLKSAYPLSHELQPPTIYLYFKQSLTHNTLPPVMSVEVMHDYRNNSQFIGRKIYHYNNTGFLFYDKLLPEITEHKEDFVGSTSANFVVHTRQQATVALLIYQYGDHINYLPKSPEQIRSHPKSLHLETKKNSSLIVNPYTFLNFTKLEQQTQYFVYMMAYSTLGNSKVITTRTFTTKALSNAASFKIITKNQIERDEVKIVRALADILKIDPARIKVVSSEKRISKSYTSSKYQNEPFYEHEIVVSPSVTKDDAPSQQIITQRLMESELGKARLQELIPNWIGKFNMSDLKIENRVKPVLRNPPVAKKISYYNATFETRYWAGARIHAILIEFLNKTLETLNYTQQKIQGHIVNSTTDPITAKQISKGLNASNHKVKDYFTSVCNKEGYASIFFNELRPGSRYLIYTAATSPQTYEPTIYSDQITLTQFYTLWNPNLRNKQKLVLDELKSLKPQLYKAIKQYYDNQEKKAQKSTSMMRK